MSSRLAKFLIDLRQGQSNLIYTMEQDISKEIHEILANYTAWHALDRSVHLSDSRDPDADGTGIIVGPLIPDSAAKG
jgi:hypothetical protein